MGDTINARIPPRIEQKLGEYCANKGVTRSEAVISALEEYLDRSSGGSSAYSLAADLIPAKGVEKIQSANVREIARKAFRGTRTR
jgi:predicted DNA-binding protein